MDDDDARTKAGYFTKMTTAQKVVFDKLRTKLNSARDDDDNKFKKALLLKKKAAGFDGMSSDNQMGFMKGIMQARDKVTNIRDSMRRSDDNARLSSRYFSQDESSRKKFDLKRLAQNKANARLGGKSQFINDNMSYNQKLGDNMTDNQKYMLMQLRQNMQNNQNGMLNLQVNNFGQKLGDMKNNMSQKMGDMTA